MTSIASYPGTAEPQPALAGRPAETRWNGLTLFAFRWSCVYFLFQWAPLILLLQVSALTAGLLNGPDWWGVLNRALGGWTIVHVLGLPEHSPPRFSANNLAVVAGMVSLGAISLAMAAAWSLLDRRRTSYRRLFAWIYAAMRYSVAAIMLLYGWHKVLPGQFDLTFDYLVLPVGQHSPRDLLWAFMAASRPYQVFAGLAEVAGGLLLLSHRTAILGALISMAAMANVLALDIAYDAPVKFLAAQLFLMTLFLLAPHARRLAAIFTSGEPVLPSPSWLSRRPAVARATRVAGVLFVAWVVSASFLAAGRQVDANERARQTPLYGIWDVEEMTRNGAAVPFLGTDATLWRRLAVQSKDAAVVIPMVDPMPRMPNAGRYAIELDGTARTVRFRPFPFSGTTQTLTFRYLLPDRDRLVLEDLSGGGPAAVVRLRRVDPNTYTLVNWQRSWRW